ncbi:MULTISPECIES: helix-turn-helix transcriptional regulator [Photorhabdus]|uniref:XRE family transcriptional regulator n=2 Tax=Photorhabdus TaxID=29487 RepID=A0A5C4RIA3_PHOLU|nr:MULTISPECIES: helix-turn-helix transcriptional regulator [Photorhabdus]MCW7548439.1 helix-turn-helix domain-containing protein [Photorhabdus aballayi]TNH43780.1 XRE family transcriptional regulator [Photorhabdus luminescens subsp. sonorensis]CAQ85219.1 cro protein (putative regulatory protein)from phage [Photorhabdus asymbiotica]
MNKISNARKVIGITQSELAKMLGWSQSRIGNYESGIRTPDLHSCREIVLALNSLGGMYCLDDIFPPKAA